MDKTPAKDPKQIWQNQRREHPTMSLEEVRTRAYMAQAKARRNLGVAFVFAILLMIFCTIAIVELPGPRVITAALMVVVLVAAYKAYKRIWSPQPLSPHAALRACTDFYRKELETQYRSVYGSVALTWRFAAALIIYAWLTANIWARSVGPLVVRILIPSLLALILFLRRREARRLKRELDALDEFEKQNV